MKYNTMVFDDLDSALDFIQALSKQNNSNLYSDIHFYPFDSSFAVDWVQAPWDQSWGGKFEFVNEDEFVLIEKVFPDGRYDYFFSEDDFDSALSEFLLSHPEYKKDDWGHWVDTSDKIN